MKAFVFPGQGAQFVGMGKDLYENSALAKELFEKANDILGYRITDIMFNGTDEDLRQTKVTQPAVFLHSVISALCLVAKLPVKQHKTKTTNRYFNYIYVRAGAYTFINKRTADDIWKNLFELPLIETSVALSEEEFLALPEFRELVAEGEKPVVVRSVCREVKHVLSHRVIYANFYEVTLPAESASFGNYRKIKAEELGQYAVPRLVHAFIEKYVDSK